MARTTDSEILLDKIPENGETIGNVTLLSKLKKWDEQKYWKIRAELINNGMIALGKGKGGSVYRLQPTKIDEKLTQDDYKKEKALYTPFHKVISKNYVLDKGIKNFISQITANQGKKSTGGKWTRPDVVIVSVNAYPYLPSKFLDIITFEIKMENDFNVTGVFETAAHSKYATKSYYCVFLPNGWKDKSPEYDRIKSECERFKIGLIYFEDPKDYATYDILVEPNRRIPDPFDMDEFISLQIEEKYKKKISEYIH